MDAVAATACGAGGLGPTRRAGAADVRGRLRQRTAPSVRPALGLTKLAAHQAIGKAELGRHLRYRPAGAHRGYRLQRECVRERPALSPLSTIITSRLISLAEVSENGTGAVSLAVGSPSQRLGVVGWLGAQ